MYLKDIHILLEAIELIELLNLLFHLKETLLLEHLIGEDFK
jgi:hypothetical protein